MIQTRYELTVYLRTASPLHSGGIDELPGRTGEETTPRRFAVDGTGKPVLTGRSIKGALRSACERSARLSPAERMALWGGVGNEKEPTRASALTFHAVSLAGLVEKGELPKRTGIAVDRYWGSAGDSALFQHEYVPTGTTLELRISATAWRPESSNGTGTDAPKEPTPEQVEELLATILGVLKQGQVRFGARTGAGWGQVEINSSYPQRAWHLTKAELGTTKGLVSLLGGGEEVPIEPREVAPARKLRATVTWSSPSGILVAEDPPDEETLKQRAKEKQAAIQPGENLTTYPTKPLMSLTVDGQERLVLPGSSVRGALRSRASRIARTILLSQSGEEARAQWATLGVHAQLAADPPLVRDLFGTTEQRGAVTVFDTLAKAQGTYREVMHNAGDRWSGGVSEGALYSEYVYDVDWNDIVVEIDVDRLAARGRRERGSAGADGLGDRARAAWCLMGLALAELCTGSLPLGSRGTRGLGEVAVQKLVIEGPDDVVPGGPWDLQGEPPSDRGAGAGAVDGASAEKAGVAIAKQLLEKLREVDASIRRGSMDAGWSEFLEESDSEDEQVDENQEARS